MYTEDELLPISALQHFVFCERQCALIHTEQVWAENRLTAEGRLLHEHVHEADNESRGDVRVVRGLRLRSLKLGLTGVADVVEFHRTTAKPAITLPGIPGRWHAYPVEYKRGLPKPDERDAVQLCAQALCLEEMLSATVNEGAVFYGKPRRRKVMPIDASLRAFCEETARRTRELLESGRLPEPVSGKKCKACSLFSLCMPTAGRSAKSAIGYLDRIVCND